MAPVNIKLNPFGATLCIIFIICALLYGFGLPSWFRKEKRVSMKELLSVSIELAKRGGERVREIRLKNTLNKKVKGETMEGAKEMLTTGDLESHRAILYGLAKAFPELKVISEEYETKPVDLENIPDANKNLEEVNKEIKSDQLIPLSQIVVWIDPLDATQEYTENLKKFVTTMVCVAVNGDPIIGVIYKPFTHETFWAWVSYGHSPNLKKLKRKKEEKTKPLNIIVSRSHKGPVTRMAKKAFGEDSQVIVAGGAGYKTLSVIEGEADVYVHVTRIKKWDICAGNAVLNALNGKMTTLSGNFIDYSSKGKAENDKGLVATVTDHYTYLDKLAPIADSLKEEKSYH